MVSESCDHVHSQICSVQVAKLPSQPYRLFMSKTICIVSTFRQNHLTVIKSLSDRVQQPDVNISRSLFRPVKYLKLTNQSIKINDGLMWRWQQL